MIERILTQQAVIALGAAAAVFVMLGSALRIRRREGQRRFATLSIYVGYTFFALSILLYIFLGFR